MMFEHLPVPKPEKKEKTKTLNRSHRKKNKNWRKEWGVLSHHSRVKQTWKEHGRVTTEAAEEVWNRNKGLCGMCGLPAGIKDKHGFPMNLEIAHLQGRGQHGSGEPWNLDLLHGPQVNSGTCHHHADHTADGREWRRKRNTELKKQYEMEGKQ